MNFDLFNIIFIVVLIIMLLTFVFIIVMIFFPKIRGKIMSHQIKATKYMIDEAQDDLTDIATKTANIAKDGIKITTRAIKEGLSENHIFCKYCGESIAEDSKYCKKCGKKIISKCAG